MSLLTNAFSSFNQATQTLRESYQTLKYQIARLNKELAESNEKLNRKVEELNRTRNYLNNILDSMTEGLIALNYKGEITLLNKTAEIISGYKSNEVLGLSYQQLFGRGNRAFSSILEKSLREKKSLMGERKFYTPNKSLLLEVSTNPINNKKGEIEGILAVFRDISIIKELQEEIRRKERLAILGEMATTIAHEIRNPLSGIEGFALLLKENLKDGLKEKKWIDNVVRGTRSLNSLLTNLLDFTHPIKPNFHQIEIKKVIEESLLFITQKIQEEKLNIQIEKRLPSGSIKINGDSILLKHAFLNLLLNATQAISEKGKITISINKKVHSCLRSRKFFKEWEGDYILAKSFEDIYINFSDTGCGISSEEKKKICQPFYTTKSKGCGLGLAITQRIIQNHGGMIKVDSKKDKGSTFTVILPCWQEVRREKV